MKIPARFENVKIEDIPSEIKRLFLEMPKSKRGIYFHGLVGTGKTHIIWALAKMGQEICTKKEEELNKEKDRKVYYSVRNFLCSIENATELLRQIKSEFDKAGNEDTLADILKPHEFSYYHPILILDDVGSEKLSDWVKETFYQIINNRYENMLPFIITSNFNIQQLAERIGDRTVSRIIEMCDIVELKGKDRRMEKVNKVLISS